MDPGSGDDGDGSSSNHSDEERDKIAPIPCDYCTRNRVVCKVRSGGRKKLTACVACHRRKGRCSLSSRKEFGRRNKKRKVTEEDVKSESGSSELQGEMRETNIRLERIEVELRQARADNALFRGRLLRELSRVASAVADPSGKGKGRDVEADEEGPENGEK